ncbi:cytochrome ubiquinol oxidase subunit I [Atopobacter phocae]|uniref:cytochrome ubiquinol oxidase subunit I n=1 Tax=Atopobacter phocae TaxID=136492 RepID=UPI0004725D2F|nr:cytochrome ubiquinol oxidase subunit I [Atopobacter phocae]
MLNMFGALDITTLARFQFAMTTVFHFFFVPFSIGTGFMVAVMETMYVIKKDEKYKKMTKFWGNIFLLSFAVGVVTGIIQEFQFGMNWSEYSRFVGDIFGAPLAIEALLAFFMESTFIGLWMFTWDRVKPAVHALFIWLVTISSMLSALWILTANAFMQKPVGFEVRNGRAEMVDFLALLKNSKLWFEFNHVIAAAIATGGIIVAGLAAFRLYKNRETHVDFYKKSIKLGLIVTLLGSALTLGAGHAQMKDLIETQPMKFAAMEGAYEDTGEPASWTLVAWANEKENKRVFGIEMPYMLSILANGNLSGSFEGMDTVNQKMIDAYGEGDYYPAVNAIFWNFRLMAGFGTLMFMIGLAGVFLTRGSDPILYKKPWMLQALGWATFLPFIANSTGWLITEMGRYPWTVYGLFRVEDSVSPNVSVTSLLISNIVYFILFSFLSVVLIYLVRRVMSLGPDYDNHPMDQTEHALNDAFSEGGL